jgi:hypothetical protein
MRCPVMRVCGSMHSNGLNATGVRYVRIGYMCILM